MVRGQGNTKNLDTCLFQKIMTVRHGLMLLWFTDLMIVIEEVTIVTSSVIFIKSINQSSIKPCLIVHLVAE